MEEAQGKPSRYVFTGKTRFRVGATFQGEGTVPVRGVKMLMKSNRLWESEVSGVKVHFYTDGETVYGDKSFVRIGYHQFAVATNWRVIKWGLSGTPAMDLPTFLKAIQDTDSLKNPNGQFTLVFDEHDGAKLKVEASFSFDGPEPGQRIRQHLTVKAAWIPEEPFPIRAADPERARMPMEELAKALKNDFWSC
jgi:hypothetical protein